MSGAVVEEMIAFDQTMKNSSTRSFKKKSKKKSEATAANDTGFEECAFIN